MAIGRISESPESFMIAEPPYPIRATSNPNRFIPESSESSDMRPTQSDARMCQSSQSSQSRIGERFVPPTERVIRLRQKHLKIKRIER